MIINDAYCIDFAIAGTPVKVPDLFVAEYDPDALAQEIKDLGKDNLSDYDRMVFFDEDEANEFLDEYIDAHEAMVKGKYCKSRDIPAMAYRTRHLVFGIMGCKLETHRTYKKDWQPGQLFNLHDRKNFVTFRLKSITKSKDGYLYKFNLLT